jgi:hypothetical protein
MTWKKQAKRNERKVYAERRSRQKSRGGSTAKPAGVGLLLEHSDVIADVVQYLGVRSLVRFGATRKSNRAAVAKEVERRKAHIAEIEDEVTLLMAAQKQPTNLTVYIQKTKK